MIFAHGLSGACSCEELKKIPKSHNKIGLSAERKTYSIGEVIEVKISIYNELGQMTTFTSPDGGDDYSILLYNFDLKRQIQFCPVTRPQNVVLSENAGPDSSVRFLLTNFRHRAHGIHYGVSDDCPLKPGKYKLSVRAFAIPSEILEFQILPKE